MVKICVFCGKEFVAERNHAKYCCSTCKNNSRYSRRRGEISEKVARDKEMAIQMYKDGAQAKDVASVIGVNVGAIYQYWKEAGLPKQLTPLQQGVRRLRLEGRCCGEICRELGIEKQQCYKLVKTVGLPFDHEEIKRSLNLGKRTSVERQYGDDDKRRSDLAEYIDQYYPEWEYVDGFKSDIRISLKCRSCGMESEFSPITIRHKIKICCPRCRFDERERKASEAIKKSEEEKRYRFWSQDFTQTEIKFVVCDECGRHFIPDQSSRKYCSDECRRKVRNRGHDRRLKKADVIDKTITLQKVYKRDNGICWICGGTCNYNDYKVINGITIVGRDYPSIDHVLPLARGGNHTWDNVRLAHCYCNTVKSDKIVL